MLKPQLVARIVRLADDGLSIRSISSATGVARVTVRQVVERRRRHRRRQLGLAGAPEPPPMDADEPPALEPEPEAEPGGLPVQNELAENGLYHVQSPLFTRLPERCPSCGVRCYMPCLACRLKRRQRRAQQQSKPPRQC